MGFATERRLAALGVHDKSTVRALGTISAEVSDSQILDIKTSPARRLVPAPAQRRRPTTLSDFVTQTFFEDGNKQEQSGVYTETEHVPIRSLDRVPRRWWPMMLALFLVVAAAAAGAWWLGFRPPAEWQRSQAWRTMHLPPMPPPAQPRWKL
jgi:hypothetical protein